MAVAKSAPALGSAGGAEENEVLTVFLGSEFYRLDLRHDHDFGDAQVRTAVTLGYDSARYFGQPKSVDRTLGVRTEIGAQLGEGARLRMGGDVVLDALGLDADTYIDPEDHRAARSWSGALRRCLRRGHRRAALRPLRAR